MSKSKLARRSASILVLGITCFAAGCSAEPSVEPSVEPSAEQSSAGPTAGESPAPAQPKAASQSAPAVAATPADAVKPRLTVDGEGLRWFLQASGSARPVPFGRPESEVLASLREVRGAPVKGDNPDCGAGPVQVASWPDGLSLIFQDGRFVGWGLGARAGGNIATAAGIGPGSTRAELEASYSATVSQTSLGNEFSAGGLHGVLDGSSARARITDMWAGVSCVAR